MSTAGPSGSGSARGARRRAARPEAETRSRALSPATEKWIGLSLWGVATLVFFVIVGMAIERKVTWYLSVDQLGYLLFAHDLLDGRVFHQWPPAEVFATLLPAQTDVLAQSYVWDQGHIYSRYAPGFPLILAGWIGLFGDGAAHVLNPLIFLGLLGILIGLEWRIRRSLWAGTAVAVLAVVCPTGVSLWAFTTTRDLSAHLCGLLGLLLLAGSGPLGIGASAAAGVALGFAGSVRPDAVLYLIPASILGFVRASGRASFASLAGVGALGVVLGLAPSLGYYWATTGNPFKPTQIMEAAEFLGSDADVVRQPSLSDERVGYAPQAWHGTTAEPVSGGGLKLEHLPTTLPGNWDKIYKAYGDVLLWLAAAGFVTLAMFRPAVALALGSYLVVTLLFYSCWGRPYGRYLIGIWLLVPVLIVEGILGSVDLVRYVVRRAGEGAGRWVAIAAAVLLTAGTLSLAPDTDGTALPSLTYLLGLGGALALGAAAGAPERRTIAVVAPVLAVALVLLGSSRLSATLAGRAPFQGAQAERASAIVRRTLSPRAVVITTEDIGRPAENFEYYGGANALYLNDLERWQIPIWKAVFYLMVAEREPYLLLPRGSNELERLLVVLRPHVLPERVAEIPPERNADYLVVSPFHAGVPLELWHLR